MTKEEREKAIDLLDNLLGMVEDNQDNDYDTALRMGIKALEQEPCEDAVSRKAMLEYQQYLHGKMSNEENHKLWEFIKELPPVTPTISEIDKFNDSVNRATVLALINDVKNADGFKDYSQYEYLFNQVDKMPMATPTRKKGKWIKEFKLITDRYTTVKKPIVTCSECSAENSSIYKNFCPNCGAEMESE